MMCTHSENREMQQQYKYTFLPSIDIVDVEATVTLAALATESLHGEARMQLEGRHAFDAEQRTCLIDASGEVGRDFNQLFLGFMRREFGRESFCVNRITGIASSAA
jgi:hypothetical protein